MSNTTYFEHLTISRTVTIQGAGPENSFLDGNSTGQVINIREDNVVSLKDLTIQNGLADSANPVGGGGVYNYQSTLNLLNVRVRQNHSHSLTWQAGGGVFNDEGLLYIAGSVVMSNTARDGGGVFNHLGTVNITDTVFIANEGKGASIYNALNSYLFVQDSEFQANEAISQSDPFYGGAVYNGHDAVIANSKFTGNTAWGNDNSGGGAIFNEGSLTLFLSVFIDNAGEGVLQSGGGAIYNTGDLKVYTSEFRSNVGTGSYSGRGGAIYSIGGSLAISETTFSQNEAFGQVSYPSEGGAISASVARIVRSTFDHNQADFCGGISMGDGAITNSTISANQALVGYGGGVCSSGAITVTHVTIYANQTITGGAGFHGTAGVSYLLNTIVAANNGGDDCYGLTTAAATNLDSDSSCDNATTQADPGLAPLAYSDGRTQTHGLWENSPALDAGDNAVCLAAPVNGIDQRGAVRPQGPTCDLGAFEGVVYPPMSYLPVLSQP